MTTETEINLSAELNYAIGFYSTTSERNLHVAAFFNLTDAREYRDEKNQYADKDSEYFIINVHSGEKIDMRLETIEQYNARKTREFLRRTEPQRRKAFWDRKERDYLDALELERAAND